MGIRLLDISFPEPRLNLALDEALLDAAQEGRAGESLRLWESPSRFVVLGVSQALAREVDEDACRRDEVPVLRRCSAGGCVVQGPGCLNFTLILSLSERPELRAIRASYCSILCRLREALATQGVAVRHEGISDLALDGRKVSGNAQKRRRGFILHHGTLVYRPDYEGMAAYLREPADRPGYRGERSHATFVGVLPLGPDALRAVVCEAFGVAGPVTTPDGDLMAAARALADGKYNDYQWIHRR